MDPPNREVVFRVRVVRDVRAKLCAMLPGAWPLRDNRVVLLLLLLLLLLRPRPRGHGVPESVSGIRFHSGASPSFPPPTSLSPVRV